MTQVVASGDERLIVCRMDDTSTYGPFRRANPCRSSSSSSGVDRRALHVDEERAGHTARPAAYRKRKQTVEPQFGNTKHNSGVHRFLRRGKVKMRTE
jgi:Transposase DDE domain